MTMSENAKITGSSTSFVYLLLAIQVQSWGTYFLPTDESQLCVIPIPLALGSVTRSKYWNAQQLRLKHMTVAILRITLRDTSWI